MYNKIYFTTTVDMCHPGFTLLMKVILCSRGGANTWIGVALPTQVKALCAITKGSRNVTQKTFIKVNCVEKGAEMTILRRHLKKKSYLMLLNLSK